VNARRPEVLAPAGDPESLRAAVAAGADAVYFGLHGFNARARATNFDSDALAATLAYLHRHGRKGYVTLNTLVFDRELAAVEAAVRACAAAGVDAVIVQDLGVARVVRAVAPTLAIHASTQMTCTDATSVELARSLGASRVILARELSLDEIAAIRSATDVELEVFVHGALCISYSGQCLTSEAIGGRSANRGACAQACRLPYELVVDGALVPDDDRARSTGEASSAIRLAPRLADRAYLLSPEDLEASALVSRLVELGVASLKIEGRLKGPAYVAATTRLYREAIDGALADAPPPTEDTREDALSTYSRGSGPGFLAGVDHQRLVEGRGCDHRGVEVAVCRGARRGVGAARRRTSLALALTAPLRLGDGLLVEGARAGRGELGGRVWSIAVGGREVDQARAGDDALVWLGPERVIPDGAALDGRRVFKSSDPTREKSILARLTEAPARHAVDIEVRGAIGEPARFRARTASGISVEIAGDTPLAVARSAPLDAALLRDKLGRLGDTPFALAALTVELPAGAMLPLSSLNRARRALVAALEARAAEATHATTAATHATLLAAARAPDRPPPPSGLFVLCRNLAQAHAAVDAGADGVYLDLLELTGTGDAVRALRARGPIHLTLAPPRVRKPGEEKIDHYLRSLAPDALLVRSLGALADDAGGPARIGDFALNVTNRLTAAEVLARGLDAFTPSFDLDATQLLALLDGELARFAEIVVHHPMPLFHMEHCVIAALLSDGHDHKTCGRPCERHQVSLRDRAGMDHPVEADVGCRNTVFHAAAQSAAELVPRLQSRGVGRFRVELVRERPVEVARIVAGYRALVDGRARASELWKALRADGGYGVVRGSLRVLTE
jgi:putative protease